MPRFFVEPGQIRDGYIYLTGQDVVHITRVLRLGRGTGSWSWTDEASLIRRLLKMPAGPG